MPDHTIPGAWIERHTLAGEWTPHHVVPGQWVGEATATTASAWPVASIEVTTYAPTTAYDRASAWPAASIEVTASVPATQITVPSAWPSASVEVTANVPTTAITYASFWPVATTEVTAYVPTTDFAAETAIYAYPNSLWVNGITDQVPYWLGAMEETDSTNIYYDGESSAFFANGGGFPSADPLNFIQGATGMRSHNTENPGEDYTDVVFTANNFVQQLPAQQTEFNTTRDRMSTLVDHFTDTLGQNPVFWIQEVFTATETAPDLGDPVSGITRDEWDNILDVQRSGSYPDWFDTLLAAVQALQPTDDIRLALMGSYFQNVVQGTALIDEDADYFFADASPHGNDVHYAIKAMIFYAYTEGYVPTSSSWTTGLPASFISNYTAIAARIEDLVLGNAVTPQALSSNDWSV